MAYTQAHLDALQAALAKGEKRVSLGDKTVEYRSVEELTAAIEAVKQWRYKPYLLNGEPVAVDTQVVVNFTLSGG